MSLSRAINLAALAFCICRPLIVREKPCRLIPVHLQVLLKHYMCASLNLSLDRTRTFFDRDFELLFGHVYHHVKEDGLLVRLFQLAFKAVVQAPESIAKGFSSFSGLARRSVQSYQVSRAIHARWSWTVSRSFFRLPSAQSPLSASPTTCN